ncbi:MAG: DUF4169 family protein [Emcibacter sp.]|nr:DUF4169 family protein [Emcibacter sp.]
MVSSDHQDKGTSVATIINFKQAGKNIARQKKEKQADANRIQFSRKKSEKTLTQKEKQNLDTHLDSHKIDGHKIEPQKPHESKNDSGTDKPED